jgi:predicted transcriptional regulator
MPVKVELTIEQIAETLRHMKKAELETLEILLDTKTEKEILKRRKEARRESYTNKQNEIL